MSEMINASVADAGANWLAEGFARRMALLARGRGASDTVCRRVWRASLAVSLATSEGHVCVPLADLVDARSSGELFPDAAPALTEWRDALFASGLCGVAGPDSAAGGDADGDAWPLLLDSDDRLYLARYYSYEARLAAALARRLGNANASGESGDGAPADGDTLTDDDRARLRRYFTAGVILADDGSLEPNWQMAAAALALQRKLVVLSGGPGTGKTTTVVGLLACLLERQPDLRVALAAPTGKAAQRMQEALSARQDLPPNVRAALPEAALTLHRLLGVLPETAEHVGRRFRHDVDNPLPYDLIVVDEASMIDLSLATQLIEAVPAQARLVMLGDKDQLAAVEAGAVFGELSAVRAFSPSMRVKLAQALDWPGAAARRVPGSDDRDGARPVLEDAVVWLEKNYRFGESSAIGRLATAIKLGRVADARRELVPDGEGEAQGRAPQADTPETAPAEGRARDEVGAPTAPADDPQADRVRLYEDGGTQLSPRHLHDLSAGYIPYLTALAAALQAAAQAGEMPTDPAQAQALASEIAAPVFAAFGRFRVLCATRTGRRGVEALNAQLTALLARQAGVMMNAGGGAWFAGRPVLVTQNEYALGLFNGDIGIALPLGPGGALRVAFATPDGKYRLYSPASLPTHETAFAMTIHKSQGSEFERVGIVLPEQISRVLTRELVYTAVTRARRQAALYAPWAAVASALARPTLRDGGLSARLREAMMAPA
ncbi:RecBCD enzyme subunit RecD [Pandoraea terrae]|uniref:RecBCD enzyme subunit RecD n=1 Tax=Pandoraea terrae TaxID=1537710 RepID=A0A5E4SYK8_9BURK|nr:exodeoxyribonuclease V subunit alpha [Pandoraea terrae]VVD78869.1 RecBCD enzyme subunit RecD [Pandoraea terrae]